MFLFSRMKRRIIRPKQASSSSSEERMEACKKARHPSEDCEDAASSWAWLPQEILLRVFQYLPLLDRAFASQVCRGWNEAFHMPELWRCFEFELNQPASSYLKATHPDLIKQIIKKHSNHLQYVSFKVRNVWACFYLFYFSRQELGNCNLIWRCNIVWLLLLYVILSGLRYVTWYKMRMQVDSSTESAEAACNILSQLVNCSIKTLGLISTARPSFMELTKVNM